MRATGASAGRARTARTRTSSAGPTCVPEVPWCGSARAVRCAGTASARRPTRPRATARPIAAAGPATRACRPAAITSATAPVRPRRATRRAHGIALTPAGRASRDRAAGPVHLSAPPLRMAERHQEHDALPGRVRGEEGGHVVVEEGEAGRAEAERVRGEVARAALDRRLELGGAVAPGPVTRPPRPR